jgi:hypothetical protein
VTRNPEHLSMFRDSNCTKQNGLSTTISFAVLQNSPTSGSAYMECPIRRVGSNGVPLTTGFFPRELRQRSKPGSSFPMCLYNRQQYRRAKEIIFP